MPRPLRADAPALTVIQDPQARFTECRALGHEWRHKGKVGGDDGTSKHRRPLSMDTGVVGYISGCSNCKMVRVKWITRSGEVMTRYEAPEGYARHGEDVMTQRQWRTSFVETAFAEWAGGPA